MTDTPHLEIGISISFGKVVSSRGAAITVQLDKVHDQLVDGHARGISVLDGAGILGDFLTITGISTTPLPSEDWTSYVWLKPVSDNLLVNTVLLRRLLWMTVLDVVHVSGYA